MARDIPGCNRYRCLNESLCLETMMKDFKTMTQMATEAIAEAQSLVSYCDYIAETIKHALPPTGVKTSSIEVNILNVKIYAEYLGKKYEITVEEA